jgi:hypothetical protein
VTLVRNERIKLSASALNTLSTAMITVGVLAPVAAFLYGLGVPNPAPTIWQLALTATIWVVVGGSLHYGALKLLGRLQP